MCPKLTAAAQSTPSQFTHWRHPGETSPPTRRKSCGKSRRTTYTAPEQGPGIRDTWRRNGNSLQVRVRQVEARHEMRTMRTPWWVRAAELLPAESLTSWVAWAVVPPWSHKTRRWCPRTQMLTHALRTGQGPPDGLVPAVARPSLLTGARMPTLHSLKPAVPLALLSKDVKGKITELKGDRRVFYL